MGSGFFVLGKLSLLLERAFTDFAIERSLLRMNSQVVFYVAILVELFIALRANIRGVVVFCVGIIYLLDNISSFFALHKLGG